MRSNSALGLMRARAAIVTAASITAAALTYGCGSTKPELDALTESWKAKMSSAIPVGTDLTAARVWFQAQGLEPHSDFRNPKDMVVWLGSIRAREWFCDRWMANVTVRASVDGKVSSYEFGTTGACL